MNDAQHHIKKNEERAHPNPLPEKGLFEAEKERPEDRVQRTARKLNRPSRLLSSACRIARSA